MLSPLHTVLQAQPALLSAKPNGQLHAPEPASKPSQQVQPWVQAEGALLAACDLQVWVDWAALGKSMAGWGGALTSRDGLYAL